MRYMLVKEKSGYTVRDDSHVHNIWAFTTLAEALDMLCCLMESGDETLPSS